MRFSRKLVLAIAVAMLWAAPAGAGHFNVVNKLPAKNPCPQQPDNQKVPDDLYDDLKKAVDDVRKSAVIDDIDKTVDKTLKDNGIKDTSSVDVEVSIAPDAASYKKMLDDSGGTLTEAQVKARFDGHVAWTDITGTKPKQKVRIVVFCGEKLRLRLIDGNGPRTIIHELVHAQLYAMAIRGLPRDKEPYKEETKDDFKKAQEENRQGHADEHNPDFSGIVERLVKLFENPPKKADPPKAAEKPKEKPKHKGAGRKKDVERAAKSDDAPVSSGVQFSIGIGFGGGGGEHRERHERREESGSALKSR